MDDPRNNDTFLTEVLPKGKRKKDIPIPAPILPDASQLSFQSTRLRETKHMDKQIRAQLDNAKSTFHKSMKDVDSRLKQQKAQKVQLLKLIDDHSDWVATHRTRTQADEDKMKKYQVDIDRTEAKIRELQQELEKRKNVMMKKQKKAERMQVYDQFLGGFIEHVSREVEDYFDEARAPESEDILRRYRELAKTKEELLNIQDTTRVNTEHTSAANRAALKEMHDKILALNSELAKKQILLDSKKRDVRDMERSLADLDEMSKDQYSLLGEVTMAIENLYARACSMVGDNFVKLRDAPPSDRFGQLNVIERHMDYFRQVLQSVPPEEIARLKQAVAERQSAERIALDAARNERRERRRLLRESEREERREGSGRKSAAPATGERDSSISSVNVAGTTSMLGTTAGPSQSYMP